jgi:guanylate kinase
MLNGQDVLLRLDVQGAATVRKLLGQDAVFIFMVAESEIALVKRLVERKTESFDKLLIRIATARKELELMSEFDYVVVNADGQLEQTVSKICSIIDAEKARVHQRCAQL